VSIPATSFVLDFRRNKTMPEVKKVTAMKLPTPTSGKPHHRPPLGPQDLKEGGKDDVLPDTPGAMPHEMERP
jgi:hypothetical protein